MNESALWIVDDDADDQFLIEVALRELTPSVPIRQLYDGKELLSSLEQAVELPRLVLLDLNMGSMNGFDVLAEMRRQPVFNQVPVVMLTTSDAEIDRQKASALGARGFITKPPSLQGISHMLQQLLKDWQR